jgi:hypothetical protein
MVAFKFLFLGALVLINSLCYAQQVCSGDAPLQLGSDICFSADAHGVTIQAHFATGAVSGQGVATVSVTFGNQINTCSQVPYTQTGGAIVFDQQKLSECLPGLFSLESVTSCSDQSAVLVHISEPVTVDFVLTSVACPANFEVLVSEGPTVYETMEACPIETAATEKSSCYSTTAFGMALSVNFTRDSAGANAGVVNFGIAQGESGKSCKQVPFTQDGQALSVDETSISKCLPDSVRLDNAKLCQGHVLISLDGFGPETLKFELDKIQCNAARRLSQEVGTFLV